MIYKWFFLFYRTFFVMKKDLCVCIYIRIYSVAQIFSLVYWLLFQNPNPEKENPPCNAQELEECDAFLEDSASLCRFDGDTMKVTHVVSAANCYRNIVKLFFMIYKLNSIIRIKICANSWYHINFFHNVKSQ